MKKFLYFLLLPLLCSCTDALLEENEILSDKFVEVSFDLGGDYDIEFEDLTRASVESGDLVGIQVYEGTTPYAYGLFNGAPTETILLKAGGSYKFECRVVKDGVSKLYHYTSGGNQMYQAPFKRSYYSNGERVTVNTALMNSIVYSTLPYSYGSVLPNPKGTLSLLSGDTYDIGNQAITRPADIVTYAGELNGYRPMENGVVRLSLKCNKAPWVTLHFTSDVPDGQVTGTMKYYGYTTQTWSLTNSSNMQFQRNTAPIAQILAGTWWGGVEQLDFSMTWERGPEANTFVTHHNNVTLNKTLYLDNDKNYTVNLHFRGQSDSDPEVWVGVDVDPDHTGDLDEEDDSNE